MLSWVMVVGAASFQPVPRASSLHISGRWGAVMVSVDRCRVRDRISNRTKKGDKSLFALSEEDTNFLV